MHSRPRFLDFVNFVSNLEFGYQPVSSTAWPTVTDICPSNHQGDLIT